MLAQKSEKKSVTLTLPYPPTLNTMYPSKKTGGRKLSDKGKVYASQVAIAFREKYGLMKPMEGRLVLTFDSWPPDNRVRDLSNIFKAVEDSLKKAGAMIDDSQIKEIHARMHDKTSGGALLITLEERDE